MQMKLEFLCVKLWLECGFDGEVEDEDKGEEERANRQLLVLFEALTQGSHPHHPASEMSRFVTLSPPCDI